MKQFFTKDRANQGKRLDLTEPDGTPTKYYIRVISADSDAFRNARLQMRRDFLDRATKDKDVKIDEAAERIKLLATTILEWNIEDEGQAVPCNTVNKIELLTQAPQIADMVDEFVHNRRLFYNKDLSGSTDSQNTPSS